MPRTFYTPVDNATRIRHFDEHITRENLLAQHPPNLTANKIDVPYRDVAEYVDVHYNLMLEDFIHPLRKALKDFKESPNDDYFNGARVYRNIEIDIRRDINYIYGNPRFLYRSSSLSFFGEEEDDKSKLPSYSHLIFKRKRPKNINSSSGLVFLDDDADEEAEVPSFGRLILFTRTDFEQDLFLGNVITDWKKTGYVEIELTGCRGAQSQLVSGTYKMMETKAFYYKYKHALHAIRSFNEDNFPMKEYIVYGSKDKRDPSYLQQSTEYAIGDHVVRVVDNETWPIAESMGMDQSQYSALVRSLTRQLAVIQGPPGTGKTYFAVRMVKVLLANVQVWNPTGQTPLLVVCQSNLVLDHFLEGLLNYTSKIVRVGDQSENEKLKPYFLNELISEELEKYDEDNIAPARLRVLRNALVVGLTTTGASARRDLLNILRSPIVIVEEAAQVLEMDVVTSLTTHCQHLILLGDHKQLKPNITTHLHGTMYNMQVSLFERLLRNQTVENSCLTTQYRMRPEISRLLKPHFYTELHDARCTLNRPPVRGLANNVFFLHHDQYEDSVPDEPGFFNDHEVKMLICLAKYLVSVGHSPSRITIIAMYAKQRNKLIEERVKYCELKGLNVTTVDGFQGNENDIILLSLVRNNPQRLIGFLKERTRICVALSRAKRGLYIIGGVEGLQNVPLRNRIRTNNVWQKVLTILREKDAVGRQLTLQCEKHDVRRTVSEPGDWKDGICKDCNEEKLSREKNEAERGQRGETAGKRRRQKRKDAVQQRNAEEIAREQQRKRDEAVKEEQRKKHEAAQRKRDENAQEEQRKRDEAVKEEKRKKHEAAQRKRDEDAQEEQRKKDEAAREKRRVDDAQLREALRLEAEDAQRRKRERSFKQICHWCCLIVALLGICLFFGASAFEVVVALLSTGYDSLRSFLYKCYAICCVFTCIMIFQVITRK